MKVLIINATFGNGSTGTIVKDIQETCLNNDIDCKVAYASTSLSANDIYGYRIGNFLSNKLHALLSRINGKQGYFSFCSTLHLIKIIDDFRPDVINIHNLHSNFVNINMLLNAISKRKIGLAVTLHDCWFFTGGCFHFTNARCSKWMESCKECPKKKLDIPAYYQDKAYEILRDRYKYFSRIKNLHLIGVSDWVKNLACQTVFKGRASSTIHNGINLSIFHNTKSDIKKKLEIEDYRIILGPASKWLDPINETLLKMVSKSLKDDEKLVLFGCNSSQKLPFSNVATLGFINDKNYLAKLYSAADLFINCSREDTLSTINLEAQACGTPIVTFDNTGSTETANPDYSQCIPTGDYKGFIESIRKMIEVKKDHSKELVQWVEDNFDRKDNYQKYVELFKSMVE